MANDTVGLHWVDGAAVDGKPARDIPRIRWASVGRGPQALALDRDASHLYAWSAIARSIWEIALVPGPNSLSTETFRKAGGLDSQRVLDLPRSSPRGAEWLRGRDLFYTARDPRISKDPRACASCHIDGQDDTLVWQNPRGLLRTRPLGGQLEAGPYGWFGEHDTLEAKVLSTFKQLGGTGLEGKDLAALIAYTRSLPAAVRASKDLGEVARQGQRLFGGEKFACATCHTEGGRRTDRALHDVGTGGAFMTPTLLGVSTGAPHARRPLFVSGRAPQALENGASLRAHRRRT